MITEHDLQEAIAECEGQRNPSASTCLKLAAFYTIKDKLYPVKEKESIMQLPVQDSFYSRSSRDSIPESDFMQIASSLDQDTLLSVMDELMNTIHAIVPKLYDGVMRKLTSL